jgi:hypothetical protein
MSTNHQSSIPKPQAIEPGMPQSYLEAMNILYPKINILLSLKISARGIYFKFFPKAQVFVSFPS